MIERTRHILRVERLLSYHPVVALLGARQVGKPTLARQILERRGGVPRRASTSRTHAGEHTFPLAEGVRAVAFARLAEDLEPLG